MDERYDVKTLFENLKKNLSELKQLLETCSSHWGYEDPVYRFYHQSFKVYKLQDTTLEIVKALKALLPDKEFNKWFMEIINSGTGRQFKHDDNARWTEVTRPILEAFFHARFFLEMAVRYGEELKYPPCRLPSGWAALLYLYGLR